MANNAQVHPRQHDETTAGLYLVLAKAERQLRIQMDRVHGAARDRRNLRLRNRPWGMTDEAALENTTPLARAEYEKFQGYVTLLSQKIADMEAIYRAAPWNRYFLVTNAGGHVHRGRSCSTCFPTTQYEWQVELADCDEDAMIIEFGEKACTVCFPDAPANPKFHGPGRRDREAQAARDAEKAVREAVKLARNLTTDEQFRGYDGSLVTTVAGCKQALRDEVEFRDYYGKGEHSFHPASVEAAALATSVLLARGVEQAEIDKIIENAVKRNRKDGARI